MTAFPGLLRVQIPPVLFGQRFLDRPDLVHRGGFEEFAVFHRQAYRLGVVNVGFFFSSRRRHTRLQGDWSSDVCSSDLVSSLGLMTMVLPVSRAGAILRAIRKKGKFQGRMPATTPSGLRSKKICSLARSLVMTSPSMRRAHSAM